MNLERIVREMTTEQIISELVNSIMNPSIRIENTDKWFYLKEKKYLFGLIKREVYCGCIAVNMIAHLLGKNFDRDAMISMMVIPGFEGTIFHVFMNMMDCLRCGQIDAYNDWATHYGFNVIKKLD